jgi:Ca2+/Na+ antiporter
MPIYVLLTTVSFLLLWIGSGIAVKSISTISHSLKLSSFTVSFFILGFFTSITEILVGTSALLDNKPEIYVGNLIGSSAVVFLVVLPILAIAGNGFRIVKNLNIKDLATTCLIALTPAILTFDNSFSVLSAIIPMMLHNIIYGAILESYASEHTARMIAMKNATDNAKELQADLKLYYNRARQGAVTQEIAEISSGAMALTQ